MKKNVMLLYPPGKLYQRGEDRCQGNIEDSAAAEMRACNDLGYCAAVLKQKGYSVFLRDYATEFRTMEDVRQDLAAFAPDLIMLSTTVTTIFEDIRFFEEVHKICPAVLVLKGAVFYDPEQDMMDLMDFTHIDYLIGGEAETCIGGIADHALRQQGDIQQVDNIFYKNAQGKMQATRFHVWFEPLDDIPFPDRSLMNNSLYVRPDTREPLATIQTSRGCSAACTYCLSPCISGKKIRFRSPENVMAELVDCYENHGIRNFFFKADTFTMDAQWVEDLCNLIIASPLYKKIQFTANSRVKPLKKETLLIMKKAGCFAVAFGYESGSSKTLKEVKKGTTPELNLQAARWAREAKLKVYGYFMIGFPWETMEDIEMTRQHIFALQPDFLELYVALPYYGTAFYDQCAQAGTLAGDTLGRDYFDSNTIGTTTVSMDQLMEIRRQILRSYYLRPSYILKRMGDCLTNPKIFFSYAKHGWLIVKSTVFAKKSS